MDTASSPPPNGAPPPSSEEEAATIAILNRATELVRRHHDPPPTLRELDRLLDLVSTTARALLVHASAGTISTGPDALYELTYDRYLTSVTGDYFETLGERYDWNLDLIARHAGYSRRDAVLRVLERHGVDFPRSARGPGGRPRK